jgi:hypothetical protein
MKDLCITSLVLVPVLLAGACGAGDDVADGARASCAYGGLLTDCEDADRTPEAACWRMVDCGAIAISNETQDYWFDWDRCVDTIERLTEERQRLVINCVAASTCDQLRVDGSPDQPNTDQLYCVQLGAR